MYQCNQDTTCLYGRLHAILAAYGIFFYTIHAFIIQKNQQNKQQTKETLRVEKPRVTTIEMPSVIYPT